MGETIDHNRVESCTAPTQYENKSLTFLNSEKKAGAPFNESSLNRHKRHKNVSNANNPTNF